MILMNYVLLLHGRLQMTIDLLPENFAGMDISGELRYDAVINLPLQNCCLNRSTQRADTSAKADPAQI